MYDTKPIGRDYILAFRRLSEIFKGNKRYFLFASIVMGLGTYFSLLVPLIIKFTVDELLQNNVSQEMNAIANYFGGVDFLRNNLWTMALAVIFITLLRGICMYYRGKYCAVGSENIAKNLKDKIFNHLQRLSFEYHVKAQTGDLIQRSSSDVETVRRFFGVQMVEVLRAVFTVGISFVIMFSLNPKLTFVSLIIVPVLMIFSGFFFKAVKEAFLRADRKEGELSTVLQENLSGVRVVRAFGRQRYELDKFEKKNLDYRDLSRKLANQMAFFWSVSGLFSSVQLGAVLIYGVYLVNAGEISLGSLLVFNTYEVMLIWPIRHLGRILTDAGKMLVSVERIYEILDTPQESDSELALTPDLSGDIVFENVSFEYEPGKPVLKDLNFTIKNGETIAILGATGCGKSTLVQLLIRLYDYTSGSVKINGTELNDIKKSWLREKIGLVLQEPFLFSKSISENIKMARETATAQDIDDATQTAAIYQTIQGFEHGYDTVLGEKGVTLSGGQKQRVAIARTLVKDSSILIFDDSLSAVDTQTDLQIREALRNRDKKNTTIIISQRITTIMEADRIFVMEAGRITHIGTHEELLALDGLYQKVWNIQNLMEESFND